MNSASEVDTHAAQLATLLKNFEQLKKNNKSMADNDPQLADEEADDDVFGSIVAQMKQLKGFLIYYLSM